MSTIKSSDEHLTLNADGSSKDIKFQANGVEKASISSAGAFTSTTIDATKLTGNLPAISAASLTNIPAANITGTLPAISGANLTNTSAGQLTGALPAIDGSALTNLVQQDPTVIPYKDLDVSGHSNITSFTIDSRGRYRINWDLRMGWASQAGFVYTYLGTSSAGGKIGNARMIIENMTQSTGAANIGLHFQQVMDFGTSLSYPYTVYLNAYTSGTSSSQLFNQSDVNGYPVMSCLKIKDISTATGMVVFGS